MHSALSTDFKLLAHLPADRGHMKYHPIVDLPGGENFRDVTALFEDAVEGDQKCLC